jgi:hypothetical protein
MAATLVRESGRELPLAAVGRTGDVNAGLAQSIYPGPPVNGPAGELGIAAGLPSADGSGVAGGVESRRALMPLALPPHGLISRAAQRDLLEREAAQPESGPPTGGTASVNAQPPAATDGSRTRGAELDEIVERVERRLLQKFAVELERRGWTPWP